MKHFLLLSVIFLASGSKLIATPSPLELIMKKADTSRGFIEDKCFGTHIKIETVKVNEYDAQISGDNTLVFQTFPASRKETMLSMNGLKTWKVSKGSKRPVFMDASQRMSGLASIGDLVGTRFYRDFNPVDAGMVTDEESKQKLQKVSLKAKSDEVLYAQIDVFLDPKSKLVVKADVLSADLKTILKKIDYKYENTFDIDGQKVPMISFMKIYRVNTEMNLVDNVTFTDIKQCKTKPKHLDLKIVMLKYRGVVIK